MEIEWKRRDKIIIIIIVLITIISLLIFHYYPFGRHRGKQPAKDLGFDISPPDKSKKIHGVFYLSNDTCASCHGNEGNTKEQLSLSGAASMACISCHDGTLEDVYNVVGGYISGTSGSRTMGGLFGTGVEGDGSLSRHDLNVLSNSGAPGGSLSGKADQNGNWETLFECSSCHEPHNIYHNYRILNPNINNIALKNKSNRERLKADNSRTIFTASKGAWVDKFPLSYDIYINGRPAELGTYKVDRAEGKVMFYSRLPRNTVVTATYYAGLKVSGEVSAYLTQSEKAKYKSGINEFCSVCHTDYDTGSVADPAHNLSGTYTEAYRHKVGCNFDTQVSGLIFGGVQGKEITCLTCHVAHGADENWWAGWAVQSGWGGIVSGEAGGDSYLKRLPNMSVCEACHQMGKADYNY